MEARPNILLVDDEPDFLEVAGAILRTEGYEVKTALSGQEAAQSAREHFHNVAILDISLPDIEGTELLSVLLDLHPDIIAVMLTGHSSLKYAVQSLNRGAFAYLEKPLSPEQLLSVISRGLEKQRLTLENRRLMGELEQRNHETSALLCVSQAVAQSLELDSILASALNKVAGVMSTDASYIYVFEADHLVFKGHHHLSEQAAEKLKKVKMESSLTKGLFEQGLPVVAQGQGAASDTALANLLPEGYHSHVFVPLGMVRTNIGVMGASTIASREFTPGELELLAAIGREVAIAIRNSQLYEEASSARALRELDALRNEFLGNVSHELRTPLAVIKGYASTMLQQDVEFDQETTHVFLESINKEADRLNRLIADLLMMSRIESGALEIKKQSHTINEMMESVKDRLFNLALKHRLFVSIPDGLPQVAADKERIAEVLTNLVENASKFSPEGSRIKIEARFNCTEVILSVSDEGVGVPAHLHEKIFQRFFQADNAACGRKRGSGLGLCICRGIVQAHGGRIWVESAPGKGARFSFSLPAN